MKKTVFHFKQFVVNHDSSTHKVGTDAVLLGAWANTSGAKTVLDIGTGSGVLALMLAQRTDKQTQIDAVEIDESNFLQASENIVGSLWAEKVCVLHSSIQDFFPNKKYNLIVSNPPYFVNSLLPPATHRQKARHTTSLSHPDLLMSVKRLLIPQGKFAVILPTAEGDKFQFMAREFGLHCSRRLAFYSRLQKPQERWLLEFTDTPTNPINETLILHLYEKEWSEEYKALTREFYLFS